MQRLTRRGFFSGIMAVLGGAILVGCTKKQEAEVDLTTPLMSEEEAAKEKEPEDLTDDEEAEEGDKPIMNDQ